jgi:hypothetical protein
LKVVFGHVHDTDVSHAPVRVWALGGPIV